MAIVASDIVARYSVVTGSAGNTTAGTGNGSLGKYVATTAWTGGTNSLFDTVTGDENAAGDVEYRCIFVLNNHATLTLESAVVWISAQAAGGTNVAIATDNLGPLAMVSASAQAATVANENTAPSGVSAFSAPTTKATGLALGNLAPGQVKAVWFQRTATNSAPLDIDNVTLSVAGDTAQ